jgi:hypothetical protein
VKEAAEALSLKKNITQARKHAQPRTVRSTGSHWSGKKLMNSVLAKINSAISYPKSSHVAMAGFLIYE